MLTLVALPAQQLFAELGKRSAPPVSADANACALVDVNADGNLDVVVASSGQNQLFRNDGHGVFDDVTTGSLPPAAALTLAVAAIDVDGDGDADLVWGNYGTDELLLNTGNGSFVAAPVGTLPAVGAATSHVVAADIDGDGDQDLLLGQDQGLRVFANDGTGTFTDVTVTSMPGGGSATPVRALAVGDIDGDGDEDIVYGGAGFVRLLRNVGAGVYADATANLPTVDSYSIADALSLADIDGGGALDLVVGFDGLQPFANRDDELWTNNGAGNFAHNSMSLPSDQQGVDDQVLFDADGDGDLDLLSVQGNRPARLLQNQGGWSFAWSTSDLLAPTEHNAMAAAVGDVDGDGDPDVVLLETSSPGQTQLAVLLREPSGYVDATKPRVPRRFGQGGLVATVDLDGDGDQDVLASDWQGRLLSFRNRGDATFTEVVVTTGTLVTSMAVADLDGDLDPDLLTVEFGELVVRVNDGAGGFTDQSLTMLPGITGANGFIVSGDVDGDGDNDIMVVGGPTRLLRNVGGVFVDVTASTMPNDLAQTGGAVLADIDGDGDQDLFAGTWSGGSARLFVNDGTGVFQNVSATQIPGGVHQTAAVAVGDVDSDGDLDLFLGDGLGQDRLWQNNGTGSFVDVSATQLPVDVDELSAAALLDVDEDGDLDLIGARMGPTNRLYLNDGAGTFADSSSPAVFGGDSVSVAFAIADFDSDGDQDVFESLASFPINRVQLNLTRQIAAPKLLRSGRPWSLECYAQNVPGSLFVVAVPYLSTTRLSVPVPAIGVLGIDPMLSLAPVLVPANGPAITTWNVPALPASIGTEIHAQALFVSWNVSLRLSNVASDPLR